MTGKYRSVSGNADSHSRRNTVSQSVGRPRCTIWTSATGTWSQPAHRIPWYMPPATTSAISVPGIRRDNGIRPISVLKMIANATSPTIGVWSTSTRGRKLINTRAIAVSEPSSPARGTIRRIQPEPAAQASLNRPLSKIAQMPMCHVWRAASSIGSDSRAWRKAGPRTKKTIPNVLGVSRPSGMAVTSCRPVRRAKRSAMAKNNRSPTRTPIAVPGTMYRRANSVGNAKPTDSRLTVSRRSAMLSNIRPKKALTSP